MGPAASDDLAGVTVLDLTIWRPGPYATQLLAERGADVLKVEPPGGDPMRAYPELFESLNAKKRSVTIDLKSDDGRREALSLAADVEVVIEGFRPGVVARLGVDYEAVRAVQPSIVYCSLSGMGQDGPLAGVSGHDLNYLAWAGVLAPEGGEPRWPAVAVADLAGGMAAAFEVCAALLRRRRTGEGAFIDVAMGDVMATWTGNASTRAAGSATEHRGSAGYGIFAAGDGGYLTLGIITEDHFWRPLCDELGMTDVRDLPAQERMTRVPELQGAIAEVIGRRGRDELVRALVAAGVPAAPVLSRAEMLQHEHFRHRRVFGD